MEFLTAHAKQLGSPEFLDSIPYIAKGLDWNVSSGNLAVSDDFSAEYDEEDDDDESVATEELSASQLILFKKEAILRVRVPEISALIPNEYEKRAAWTTPHGKGKYI